MGKTGDKKQEKVVKDNKKAQFYNKWWFWVTVIAVPAVIACVAIIGSLRANIDSPSTQSEEVSSVEELVASEPIRDGNSAQLEFSNGLFLTSSGYLRPWSFYDKWSAPEYGKEYVAISIGILNNSQNEMVYDYSDFTLRAKSGEIMEVPRYGAIIADDDSSDMMLDEGVLRQGESVVGYIIFEIDKTQKLSDVQLVYSNASDSLSSYRSSGANIPIYNGYFNF